MKTESPQTSAVESLLSELDLTDLPVGGTNLINAVAVGLKEIWAHKFRSALTMLGIVLGVSSLIAMSAMVKGMEIGQKEALLASGGLRKVRLEAQSVPVQQRHLRDFARGMTLSDATAIEAGVPDAEIVAPEMRLEDNPTLAANGKLFRTYMTLGVYPKQAAVSEHVVQHGRIFNDIDADEARAVCVIGTGIRDELFGRPEETGTEVIPIGKTMTINGQPFTIIGMFQLYEGEQDRKARLAAAAAKAAVLASGKKETTGPQRGRGRGGGSYAFWIKNNTVYMPLNTMWQRFQSSRSNAPAEPRLSTIEIKLHDFDRLNQSLVKIRNIMLVNHRGIEDFSFRTLEDWGEDIDRFVRNARLSGSLIAGISLFVGGIGIMNIMLASINERIREIGTCKAIGATGLDIFIQIIVESVVLALLGALAGLVASQFLVDLLSYISPTGNTPVITWWAQALAVVFSGGVGIVAGLIPAFKAARLEPIQALRYE